MEEIVTHNFSPELEPGLTTEAGAVTGNGWGLTTGHVSPVSPGLAAILASEIPAAITQSAVCSQDHHGG